MLDKLNQNRLINSVKFWCVEQGPVQGGVKVGPILVMPGGVGIYMVQELMIFVFISRFSFVG
jgi:hypothetical protein